MILEALRRWEQRIGALPMPSPLIWSALIAAFLGFGVLMGRATGPDSLGALAASRAPLKLLVARASPPSIPSSSLAATPPPPRSQAETTPESSITPASPPKIAEQPPRSGTSSTPRTSTHAEETRRVSEGSTRGASNKLPAIKHVFVVMLSDEPYATAFGPASPAHYLSVTLEKKGQLLVRYYAVAHDGLANEIALLSGQGPTEANAANCPTYSDIVPAGVGADAQVLGRGCIYPASTDTLVGQLAAKHLTWRAYVEGTDEGASVAGACARPAPVAGDPNGADPNGASQVTGLNQSTGATQRNPFVYFHSITSANCAANDAGIGALQHDLASEKSTPNFSYIAPGPCDDGSPIPCAPGAGSGMTAADDFLKKIVPKILSSKAYKENGLLAITVDNAPSSGEYADSSSCCGQPRFPNLPAPSGAAALSPQGGGQVGLLLLSPFLKGGGLVQDPYNHFSLLATIEQAFGLSRLGYAGLSEVKPLSPSLFSGG
jgi:hypothetical protein